jgi:cytochrome c oxidase subunit III
MLTFLVSEAVLFGSLIYAYIHLRLHAGQWPPPGMPHFHLLLPSINSVILIGSGFVAHYALVAFRQGRLDAFRRLMAVTMVMGAAFLGGQAWEYTHVGFGLSSGLLGSTFFTITGLHGAHVTGGLILLAYLLFREWRDRRIGLARPSGGTSGMAPAATYYWHFVDGVWVVIFFVIYLL